MSKLCLYEMYKVVSLSEEERAFDVCGMAKEDKS